MNLSDETYNRIKDSDKLVLPGTKLATIEEFYAGNGTYSTDDYVYSATTGHVNINMSKYEISVISKPKSAPIPKKGSICMGSVSHVSRQIASISVNYINNTEVHPSYTCLIHISQISKEYLDNIGDAICPGDIIRCKLIDAKTLPLQGTMVDNQLGVIIGYCVKCGEELEKIGKDKLKCPQCNYIQKRKLALDYGINRSGFKL